MRWTSLKTEIKLLKSDMIIDLFLYFKSNDQIIFIRYKYNLNLKKKKMLSVFQSNNVPRSCIPLTKEIPKKPFSLVPGGSELNMLL